MTRRAKDILTRWFGGVGYRRDFDEETRKPLVPYITINQAVNGGPESLLHRSVTMRLELDEAERLIVDLVKWVGKARAVVLHENGGVEVKRCKRCRETTQPICANGFCADCCELVCDDFGYVRTGFNADHL